MKERNLTFSFHPGNCPDCWDSTVVLTPHGPGKCITCLNSGEPLQAASRIAECVWSRVERDKEINPQVLNTARALIHATSELPLAGGSLQVLLRVDRRVVSACVEELRKEWGLPIGSTRQGGYYWMHTASDFINWSRSYRNQAITSLVTLYKMQRKNFPELAGQESFQFVEQIEDELREALR